MAALMADEDAVHNYAALFDRTSETFYKKPDGPQGKGEQPTWNPNEAYMQSAEQLWNAATPILNEYGLAIDQTLRALFVTTREYKDTETVHRRVFFGNLCREETPVTAFMFTIPHSHERFDLPSAPYMQIAPGVPKKEKE